jgi:hypothetical protein
MKKALLFIAGLGVLSTGVYLYFKKQMDLISKFTWKISSFKVNKISLTNLDINLNIRFTSVADLEAKVNRVYLDLFLEGKNVGYVTQTESFIIPAHGSSDVPINISINPQSILKNITDIVLGVTKDKDVKFKVKGFADVKSGFFSTTLPIEYETSIKEYLKKVPTL